MIGMIEPIKTASRTTIFNAISVVVTYLVNLILPTDMPAEVRASILLLILAGITYAISFADSWIHNQNKGFFKKWNGLTNF